MLGIYDEIGETNYLHSNHVGSVTTVTSADGSVVGEKEYTPFGLSRSSSGEVDTNLGFIGRKQYEEIGLTYIRARFYEPASVRFITKDPVRDGFNWYSYCGGNPVVFVDRSGLYGLRKFYRGVKSVDYDGDNLNEIVGKDLYYTISFDSHSKMAFNLLFSIIGWGGVNAALNTLGYADEVVSGNSKDAGSKIVEDTFSKYSNEISMLLNVRRLAKISKDSLIQKKWEELYGCPNPGDYGQIHDRKDLIIKLGTIYDYYGWNKSEIKKKFQNAKKGDYWTTYIDEIPKEFRGDGFYEIPW